MNKKEDVNLLVPFGYSDTQPEREDLLHFVIEKCVANQTYPNTRIVLVECSEKPTQETYAKANCDQYVFLPQHGVYSAGGVQNEGFLRAKPAQYIYLHQADFLLPPEMVEKTVEQIANMDAPVIFPFFSSVNLSKPLTEAVVSGPVNWQEALFALTQINAGVRKETNRTGILERKYFSEADLRPLLSILPVQLQIGFLMSLGAEKIWGKDDGAFTYFGDSFQVVKPSETLIKYRPGGRAKASYLCRSEDYIKLGGSPEYVGWGYEDLGFWARVQAMYDYKRGDDGEMYFKNTSVSTDYPIVHLWHSTINKPDYFGMMETNRKLYEEFLAMTREEKLKFIKPLNK